jgi:CAAX prenyl protease-like protein
MLSHLLPYLLFVGPPACTDLLPPGLRPWVDPFRTVATGVALLVYWRRGAYPELRRGTAAVPHATRLGVLAGVAVATLWIPLARIVPEVGSRGWFCPELGGPGAAPFLWLSRIVALVVVVPFAEELFVRSFVPRWTDALEGWRDRPVGVFTKWSAGVSVAFFTATHPEWLAALVTGALWTWLVARTRRLGDAVLAHAIANGMLAVVWGQIGDRSWW